MGIPMSLLGKFGLPGVNSAATNKVYEEYFSKKPITTFEEFHTPFVQFCKDFNAALPGKHYDLTPRIDEIEKFYEDWSKSTDEEKKTKFFKFIDEKLCERKTNPNVMIMTGLVAPGAAIVLKRTGESVPAVKKFRLHLIPDFVFVPSCTLVALIGVRILQIKNKSAF